MKTNITLKLDEALLREARSRPTREGVSVSSLLSSCLEQVVGARRDYTLAGKRAMARLRNGLGLHWTTARSPDELHERD